MSKKHEMGTDEYLKYLQSETPGELETSYNESVEEFIKEVKNANDDKKKKHFLNTKSVSDGNYTSTNYEIYTIVINNT